MTTIIHDPELLAIYLCIERMWIAGMHIISPAATVFTSQRTWAKKRQLRTSKATSKLHAARNVLSQISVVFRSIQFALKLLDV